MIDEKDSDSPSKLPRLSGANSNAGAASSPLVLGLGLGVGGDGDGSGERDAGAQAAARSVLTFMQLQELEHQVLIYRFFTAGVPVPVQLVLPIWRSVTASSFGPQHFPSLTGLGSLCYEYRGSMETDPGRCRRTDGKKWRCSRDVLQGLKFCERHVNRARVRYRSPWKQPRPREQEERSTSAPHPRLRMSASTSPPQRHRARHAPDRPPAEPPLSVFGACGKRYLQGLCRVLL